MIRAEAAISRFHRDLLFSWILRLSLVGAAILYVLLQPLLGWPLDSTLVLAVIGGFWLVLSYRSMMGSRLAADSPWLIASGRYDEAERRIQQALWSFSLFRTVKLLSLHHLAMLRHAQHRWQESAMLCQALLRQRLGPLEGLAKPSRLILADALLEMGDLQGAYRVMIALYRQRLSLGEALNLLQMQLDYQARLGAWQQMMDQPAVKLQLAELMPGPASVRTQALLALAAHKTGRTDWADWLRRRVELLGEVQQLTNERPILRELWEQKIVA